MNNLRMVVAGTYTPTCVSVNVAPDFGSGSEWQQRTYSDADAPVVVVDELEATIDYENDMEDRMFWSRGGW